MASNLLVMLLPFLSKLGAIFLRRLVREAADGTLPPQLKPYASEVTEICTFLLAVIDQKPVAPEVAGTANASAEASTVAEILAPGAGG